MTDTDDIQRRVLSAAREMHALGLVVGTAGNVSARLDDADLVCMTPASMPYDAMTVDDLVTVDLDGRVVGPTGGKPTTEKDLHLACYRRHPDVGGVVHTHAPHASMFAVVGASIPAAIEEAVLYIGGEVPCAGYRPTGTAALGEEVSARVADRSATLMTNHGLVCIGRDPGDALHTSLVVERTAQIVWGARQLGAVRALPDDVMDGLKERYRAGRAHWRG